MKFVATAMALGVAASLTLSTAATADPKGPSFPISCENGHDYWITVNGNGAFTPAHDVNSTATLIPTSFTAFHGELVQDSTGDVVMTVDEPASAKGQSGNHPRRTTTSCTFTVVDHSTDPDLGDVTFTGTGGVTGFITPTR